MSDRQRFFRFTSRRLLGFPVHSMSVKSFRTIIFCGASWLHVYAADLRAVGRSDGAMRAKRDDLGFRCAI
jgi:hypothetical protein